MEPYDCLDPIRNPADWTVVRHCVDISPETSLVSSLSVTLKHKSGTERTLVFEAPHIPEFSPLRIPDARHIRVSDTDGHGWESSARLEVSDLHEDQTTLFWASSVAARA